MYLRLFFRSLELPNCTKLIVCNLRAKEHQFRIDFDQNKTPNKEMKNVLQKN